MNFTDAVIKGIFVGLFMAISVGPTLFVIFRYSLTYSYKAGLAFVLGVSVSDIIYVTIANVAATWLQILTPYQRIIGIGGAIALMTIGLAGLFKKQSLASAKSTTDEVSGSDYFKIWLGGFLVNTLNPGVIVTWLGAVTIIANEPAVYRIVLFGIALFIILGIDFLKVFLAGKLKLLITAKRVGYMQKFSAVCIFFIGLFLMITTLSSKSSGKGREEGGVNKILSIR
jgi:threonine/homoserine/homoserine lactone efflux protein